MFFSNIFERTNYGKKKESDGLFVISGWQNKAFWPIFAHFFKRRFYRPGEVKILTLPA